MTKILSTKLAIQFAKKLHQQNKSIVLAGGCFDILHAGHRAFLEAAKKQGDVLFVFLENDPHIRQMKGPQRPFNTQQNRAKLLTTITSVDYIVMLPEIMTDEDYDNLVIQLKPAIIATTAGDPSRKHKERQANRCGASVSDVITKIDNQSTTRFANFMKNHQ